MGHTRMRRVVTRSEKTIKFLEYLQVVTKQLHADGNEVGVARTLKLGNAGDLGRVLDPIEGSTLSGGCCINCSVIGIKASFRHSSMESRDPSSPQHYDCRAVALYGDTSR